MSLRPREYQNAEEDRKEHWDSIYGWGKGMYPNDWTGKRPDEKARAAGPEAYEMYQWLNHHFSRMVHGGWEALAPQIIDDDEDQAFLIGPQSTHIEIPMPALGLLFGQAVQLIGSLLELDEIVTKAHEALVNMKVYVKALNVSTA